MSQDVIFGSGNANGSFTVSTGTYTVGGNTYTIELGLRAKLRFDDANQAQNTFNYDGVDGYAFGAGTPPTGFSFAANSPTTPIWNFEWSINTDVGSSGGPTAGESALDDLTYQLRLDGDTGAGTNFLAFDPINIPSTSTPDFADHAIGDNTTGNGAGTSAGDRNEYLTLIGTNNVAQNSWSYEFFNEPGTALASFDPTQLGQYTIQLEAFDGTNNSIASTSIDVNVVPVPFSAPLLLGALGGLALLRRRKAA